jgi:hypothetical protein
MDLRHRGKSIREEETRLGRGKERVTGADRGINDARVYRNR